MLSVASKVGTAPIFTSCLLSEGSLIFYLQQLNILIIPVTVPYVL